MYLNSGISSDNENLDILDWSDLIIFLMINEVMFVFVFLPIQIQRTSILHDCFNLEIAIDGKLCNLICLYRSPNQNVKEFETFVKKVELNLEFIFNKNPYLIVAICDFNAKSHNWYKGDKTTGGGSNLDIMTSHYGITQIINEPTHILEDS